MTEAREAIAPAAALCDIATAARIRGEALPRDIVEKRWVTAKDSLSGSKAHKQALAEMKDLPPFHFPIAFPEVFLRERAGFDVILGNPPWEEATVEEDAFWTRHSPGLHGIGQREKERRMAEFRDDRDRKSVV